MRSQVCQINITENQKVIERIAAQHSETQEPVASHGFSSFTLEHADLTQCDNALQVSLCVTSRAETIVFRTLPHRLNRQSIADC